MHFCLNREGQSKGARHSLVTGLLRSPKAGAAGSSSLDTQQLDTQVSEHLLWLLSAPGAGSSGCCQPCPATCKALGSWRHPSGTGRTSEVAGTALGTDQG